MVKIKLDLEKIILPIFIASMLFIGPGAILDHKISHEFPFGYMASDAFQHQVRAEAIKDTGNFRHEAPYISKGLEGIVGRYPPLMYHLTVILSYISGIEVFDAIIFMVYLFTILAAIVMYLLIKDIGKNLAIISLPFSVVIFTVPLSIGFLWGHWPSLVSQFFLVAFFWAVSKIDQRYSFVLISVFLCAMLMAHSSEAAFAIIFLGFYFLFSFIGKSFSWKKARVVIYSIMIAAAIASYYLIIFQQTFGASQPYAFKVEPKWEGNPGFYISQFGLLLIPLIAGLIFAAFKIKNMPIALIASITMLAGGFLNYVGFTFRSFQVRFLWPIYLSALMAFGLYMLIKLVFKNWNFIITPAVFVIVAFLLLGFVKVPMLFQHESVKGPGIMDPYHWDALKWISENTKGDSKVYFFHGDVYSQDALLRNSKRVHAQVDTDDFIGSINNRTIRRHYLSEFPGDNGGGLYSWSKFPFMVNSGEGKFEVFYSNMDICKFDYFIFDKGSRQEALARYNLLIASGMINRSATIAHQNDLVLVLKNNNVGGVCIEERSF